MVLSPKTTAQVLSAMMGFYFVSIAFTNFAAKNYGEENASDQAVRTYQWCALSFSWTMVPFLIAGRWPLSPLRNSMFSNFLTSIELL